jgi:hypothetical protein
MKKWKREIHRKVGKYAKWWIRYTGLGYWDVRINFFDNFENFPREAGATAFVTVEWKYMDATIHISYEACRGLKNWELEKVIVHELAHVFLSEAREDGTDHEERVATLLQKAFCWVRVNAKHE